MRNISVIHDPDNRHNRIIQRTPYQTIKGYCNIHTPHRILNTIQHHFQKLDHLLARLYSKFLIQPLIMLQQISHFSAIIQFKPDILEFTPFFQLGNRRTIRRKFEFIDRCIFQLLVFITENFRIIHNDILPISDLISASKLHPKVFILNN